MLVAWFGTAWACGALFTSTDEFAVSSTQEVILRSPEDGQVRVSYRIIADRDATDFGWVIPLPGTFVSIADGDPEEFERLREATKPEEDLEKVSGGGCGGAARSKGGGATLGIDSGTPGVTVVATGFTGSYQYAALDATSSDALLAWLDDHGYALGTAGPLIDAYVAEGRWQFVALQLETSVTERRTEELPPLDLVYAGEELVYPARITASSTAPTQHTILYVMGGEGATVAGGGWGEVDLPTVWDDGEDPDTMRYAIWPEALADIGADGAFARVFSGHAGGAWVTRYETIAPTATYEIGDVELSFGGDTTEFRTVISNRGGCAKPDGVALSLLPALGWLLRRRVRARTPV